MKVRGEEFSMRRILSELDPLQRHLLLIATDFGIAVCLAKLVVHLLRFF
jgi:hypothetical protein